MAFDESAKGVFVHFAPPGDRFFGDSLPCQAADVLLFSGEFVPAGRVVPAFWPAEDYTIGLSPGKGLFGALAYEGAFNLGRQAECECQHLALDVFSQPVAVLDGPHLAFLVHANVENLHDHEEASAKARKFGADYKIVLLDHPEQFPKRAFVKTLCPADCFFYPAVNADAPVPAEFLNLKPLVFHRLPV